jgi:hypothetical protein
MHAQGRSQERERVRAGLRLDRNVDCCRDLVCVRSSRCLLLHCFCLLPYRYSHCFYDFRHPLESEYPLTELSNPFFEIHGLLCAGKGNKGFQI